MGRGTSSRPLPLTPVLPNEDLTQLFVRTYIGLSFRQKEDLPEGLRDLAYACLPQLNEKAAWFNVIAQGARLAGFYGHFIDERSNWCSVCESSSARQSHPTRNPARDPIFHPNSYMPTSPIY